VGFERPLQALPQEWRTGHSSRARFTLEEVVQHEMCWRNDYNKLPSVGAILIEVRHLQSLFDSQIFPGHYWSPDAGGKQEFDGELLPKANTAGVGLGPAKATAFRLGFVSESATADKGDQK
jgi:hypothetical protein